MVSHNFNVIKESLIEELTFQQKFEISGGRVFLRQVPVGFKEW